MRHATLGIWAALLAAHAGCMDLDLLDDLVPIDGGEPGDEGAGGSDGDADGDADGDTSEDGPPATDPADGAAPAVVAASCGVSEIDVGGACVAQGRGAISVRLATDEPASLDVLAPAGIRAEVLSAPWSTEHLVVAVGLPAAPAVELQVGLADVNGNADAITLPVAALEGSGVSITEVLADPMGEEPAQEFVEIANFGAEAVDLSGWMIDDGGDQNGDAIPDGTSLVPGQVALLVAPSFDPASGEDPAPDAAALIVYLESSIGTSGLTNSSAETIELYDAFGGLVSGYDGRLGGPLSGRSASRLRAELPDGCPLAFGSAPVAPSTPGAAPFVP